jgi:hypothetical protein
MRLTRRRYSRALSSYLLSLAPLLGLLVAGPALADGGTQKLVTVDTESGDLRGQAVAMQGETVVVGAPGDDGGAGSATVYVRCAGFLVEQGRLTASDAAAGDGFGTAVAVSGNTIVVAASSSDGAGSDSGSVYVFTRSDGSWRQQQKLTASDAASGDLFGTSVSVDGDTVVVGSPGNAEGAAYAFTRTAGSWTQQQKITVVGGFTGDNFGVAVSVSGDSVAIGADGVDEADENAGGLHVFTRTSGAWTLQESLLASNAAADDHFGITVSLDGDTVAVGADRADGSASDTGAAYVFTRSAGSWTEQQVLTASDATLGDSFGGNVSLSGDTLAVSALGDDSFQGTGGKAYVFRLTAGTWSEITKCTDEFGIDGDLFGSSVATNGGSVVVGAPDDSGAGGALGAAYVFSVPCKLTASDAAEGDIFGSSAAVSGNTMVIGAPFRDEAGELSGAAYVFTRSNGTWTETQKLVPADASSQELFGSSVAVDGDTLVVGARDDDSAASSAGSAYVFVRAGGTWSEQQELFASDAGMNDDFGFSVSLSGDTVVVGAIEDDDTADGSGSVYVFTRSGTIWTQQQKLTASDPGENDHFGNSVSLDGDVVLVGAWKDDDSETDSGSAYLFARSDGTWAQQQKLTATTPAAGQAFGESVSLFGNTAVVGAPLELGVGQAHVFTAIGTTWTLEQMLSASDAHTSNFFGRSVSVYGNTIVVGATGTSGAGSETGSAYVFTRSSTTWTEQRILTATDPAARDLFGQTVVVDGDTVVVSAHRDDDDGTNSGSVHCFPGYDADAGPAFARHVMLTVVSSPTATNFGAAVAADGDTIAIGTPQGNTSGAGAVYVFTKAGDTLTGPSSRRSSPPTRPSKIDSVRLWPSAATRCSSGPGARTMVPPRPARPTCSSGRTERGRCSRGSRPRTWTRRIVSASPSIWTATSPSSEHQSSTPMQRPDPPMSSRAPVPPGPKSRS